MDREFYNENIERCLAELGFTAEQMMFPTDKEFVQVKTWMVEEMESLT